MANDFDESSANEEASKGLSWWYSADVLSRDKSDKTAKRIRRISITGPSAQATRAVCPWCISAH